MIAQLYEKFAQSIQQRTYLCVWYKRRQWQQASYAGDAQCGWCNTIDQDGISSGQPSKRTTHSLVIIRPLVADNPTTMKLMHD